MRRLIVSFMLVVAGVVSAAPAVSAETAGGTTTDTRAAMGRIAAGDRTNCVVIDGRVACWGENFDGQIGDGTTSDRSVATYVPGLTGVQSVAVSQDNTCVVLTNGRVKCWGDGTYGQLGDNNATNDSLSPVNVCAVDGCVNGLLEGVTQISLGNGFACALLSGGTVACWGFNMVNQLGITGLTWINYPQIVTGLTGVTSITSGSQHTCAIINDGTVKCWGAGAWGQLGNGGNTNSTPVTANAGGLTGVTAIAATRNATCAIVSDSTVRCWGGDSANELGYDAGNPSPRTYNTMSDGNSPTAVHTPIMPQLDGSPILAKAIDGGPRGVCVISTTNRLACWGSIAGLGTSTGGINFGSAFSSNWVSGMTATTNVAVGTSTVCATNADQVSCWGSGPFGELGNGAATQSSTSAAVPVLGLVPQTVSFAALSNRTTTDAPFALSATSSSGQAVTFATSTGSVCTAAQSGPGWALTIVGPGQCSVTATAAGGNVNGTSYAPASVTNTFNVTAVAPLTTLASAASITTTTATLSATLNPALLSTTSVFRYSTRQDLGGATTVGSTTTVAGAGTVTLTASLTGLSPGVTYFFTFVATNSIGTTTATTQSFTTVGFAPTGSTGAATSISSSRATLNASVTPGGLSTDIWFVIGEKQDLSDGRRIDYRPLSDLTSMDISVAAIGLSESTRYFFRVEASNALGSLRGETRSFTASRPLGITINDAAEFTNSRRVTVFATGPSGATQVILSNDGGFGSSQTFSLTDGYAEIPWTLIASRDERLPKTVYARFVQRFGTQSSTNTDDIILDTTAPTMTSAAASTAAASPSNVTVASARGGVRVTVRASDRNSGIGKVQMRTSTRGRITDVATSNPKASSRTVRVNTTRKRLWVRVVDRAGNTSRWVTVNVR